MDKLPLDSISLSQELRIDPHCREFERELRGKKQPRIEDYLLKVPEATRPALFRELFRLELEFLGRRNPDTTPKVGSFLNRFPEYSLQIQEVLASTGSRISSPGKDVAADVSPRPGAAATISQAHASIETSRTGIPTSSISHPETPVPKTFGRYQIEKELGKGAMGVVYLAEDTQLGRKVALKIPKKSILEESDALERFYREAKTTSQIRHPNICPVFDVGAIDGTHYLTMAYIPGKPISTFLGKGKLPPAKQVALLIRKIALAIEEAHKNGIIHRDLKPSNVMLDDRNEPIVMDFGLARQVNTKENTRLTQSGAILGTPAYMAPEQVRGQLDQIGPHSDVYALGVMMYQLLTGELPFSGAVYEVFAEILTKQPARPCELRPDVDPPLEAICLKMMSKEIPHRYSSMKDVAATLTEYLKTTAAISSPPPAVATESLPIIVTDTESSLPSGLRRAKTSGNFSWTRGRLMLIGSAALGLLLLLAVIIIIEHSDGTKTKITVDITAPSDPTQISKPPDSPRLNDSDPPQPVSSDNGIEDISTKSPDDGQQLLKELRYGIAIQETSRAIEDGDLPKAQSLLSNSLPQPGEKDSRGWEWHYLNAINRKPQITVKPEGSGYFHLDWHPDGKSIVTSGMYSPAIAFYNPIQQWSADDGRLINADFRKGAYAVWQPQGSLLAFISQKKEVCVIDKPDGPQPEIVYVLRFMPKHMVWSWDGRYLAVISGDSTWQNSQQSITGSELIIWDAKSRKIEQEQTYKDKDLYSLAWSPDSARIAISMIGETSAQNGTFLFDRKSVKESDFSLNPGLSSRIKWSTDGRYILKNESNAMGQNIQVEESDGARRVATLSPGGTYDISRSAEGLLANAYDGMLKVSRVLAKSRRTIAFPVRSVDTVAWSRDGKRLALSGRNQRNGNSEASTVSVWNIGELPAFHEELYLDIDHPAAVPNHKLSNQWCSWLPDSQRILSADDDGFVTVMTLDDDTDERNVISARIGGLIWVGPNRDGRILAAVSKAGEVAVCSDLKANQFEKLPISNGNVTAAVWCPRQDLLALGMNSGDIELWNAAGGTRVGSWAALSSPIKRLDCGTAGDWLAACDTNGKSCLFQIPKPNGSPDIKTLDAVVSDLAMSADGKQLAVADADGHIAILTTANRTLTPSLQTVTGAVQSLAWSPDGNRLAVCNSDGYVHICNPKTNQELLRLPKTEVLRRGTPHRQVCWSPDGRRLLASGNNDVFARHETIHVWTAATNTSVQISSSEIPQGKTNTPAATVPVKTLDRELAKLVIQKKGMVSFRTKSKNWSGIDKLPDLPNESFDLYDISTFEPPGLADEDLKRVVPIAEKLTLLRLCNIPPDQNRLTASGLEVVSRMKNLNSLVLTGNGVTKSMLDAVGPLPALEQLFLGNTPMRDDWLNLLQRYPRLRSLSVGITELSAAGIERLVQQHPNLTELNVQRLPLTERTITSICSLSNLKTLRLEGADCTDRALETIGRMQQLQLLLARGGDSITDIGIAHIPDCKTLVALDLEGTAITDASFEHLAKLPKLTTLWVKKTSVTLEGVSNFRELRQNCKVYWESPDRAATESKLELETHRDLAEWILSRGGSVVLHGRDGNIDSLNDLPSGDCSLQQVRLKLDKIPDAILRILGKDRTIQGIHLNSRSLRDGMIDEITSNRAIVWLSLCDSQITDAGVQKLALLRDLVVLELADNGISDSALNVLRDLEHIEFLGLNATKVGDPGMEKVSGLSNLSQLRLDDTRVTDRGVADLSRCSKLHQLSLRNTAVSDASIDHLAKLSSLEELNVRGSRITLTGAKKLAERLPECAIDILE